MRAVLLGGDLLLGSRITAAADAAGADMKRAERVTDLPPSYQVDLLFVDWSAREPGWAEAIARWRDAAGAAPPRLVLFGPHTDLRAHREARSAGIGPMMARSQLVSRLPILFGPAEAAPRP